MPEVMKPSEIGTSAGNRKGNDRSEIDWPAVLDQNGRWLRLVVHSRLKEAEATDEVMQNLALAVVRQRAPLRDPARLSAWLYRLAVRQVLLYRRSLGRSRRTLDRFVRQLHPKTHENGHDPDPLGWLIRRERGQMVRDIVERLPPRDSEILLLKYVENWTSRELADRLGVTTSAVEARLHRARRRLRDELTQSRAVEPCEAKELS